MNKELEKDESELTIENIQIQDNDIIKDEFVEPEKSDHVENKTQTHENIGHRDPNNLTPENDADQDAIETEKKIYKTFETKKALSDYVAKKVKNKNEENEVLKTENQKQKDEILVLKKKVEQLRNVEFQNFYKPNSKKENPKTYEESIKGLQ